MFRIEPKTQYWMEACMFFVLIIQTVITFTVFSFLQPLSYLVWGSCILSFLVMLVLTIRTRQIDFFGLGVLVYFLLLTAFTLINGTAMFQALYTIINAFLLCMLASYYRHNLKVMMQACAVAFSCSIYGNLLLMIVFPDWMFAAEDVFDSFILGGNYNQMGGRMICGIVTSIMCIKINRWWLVNVIGLFITSVITLVMVGSMTALSGIIVFALFCMVPSLRLQKIGLVAFVIFYLLFQIFVVFSGEGLHNNALAVYIIEDLLEKDLTFTNRTEMWDSAGKMFAQSPFFGYGEVDNEWYVTRMNSFAIGPHNFIYSILIRGGLTLMAVFIAICVLVIHRIRLHFDKTACILCMGTATFFFMMLMEVYPVFFVFYLFAFMYYYPDIIESLKIQES